MGFDIRRDLLGDTMTKKTINELTVLMARFSVIGLKVTEDMGDGGYLISGTKNSGQLRRLSMDITRKLAELRAGK